MTDDKLRELGRDLAWDRPDAARREAVRAQLLLAADDAPPLRRHRGLAITGGAFTAGALAAAVIALLVVRREPVRVAAPRAQITASSAAELEHTVTPTASGSDEVVRVHAGTVRVAAPAPRANERVQVVTHDAAVDGAGDYEVAVAHDLLASVTVHAGTARIAVTGHAQPVFLATGETWHAAVITTDLVGGAARDAQAPSVASPSVASPSVASPSASPAIAAAIEAPRAVPSHAGAVHTETVAPAVRGEPAARSPVLPELAPIAGGHALAYTDRPAAAIARPGSPIERHFQAGWSLLRAGKSREAARELGLAADAGASDRDALASDARYFQAVALIKAGATGDAEHALVAFLDHAPGSLRRGRAAVMLARLIGQRGDARTARGWFESALHDPDPDVAAAARAGLAP